MKISKFQVKLSVTFALLTLVPTMVLAFLSAQILMHSLNLLPLSRIEKALVGSAYVGQTLLDREREEVLKIAWEAVSKLSVKRSSDFLALLKEKNCSSISLLDLKSNKTTLLAGVVEKGTPKLETELKREALKDKGYAFQSGNYTCGVAPISEDGVPKEAILVLRPLDPKIYQSAEDIRGALRDYTRFNSIQEDIRKLVWRAALLIAALLIFLGAIIGSFLARKVTEPILRLVAGTEEIGKGELSYRVEPGPGDEVGVLIDSFNKMASELESGREKLLYAERRAAWRDTARILAHEIKNPLTPIQLSLGRLRNRLDRTPAEFANLFKECAEAIDRQVENIRRTVDEFSSFARMPEPTLKTDHLNETVRQVLTLHAHENIQFDVGLNDNIPTFPFDRGQIAQAFGNIILNSIQAMPEGGKIKVITRCESDWAILQVEDNGPGMSKETMDKIFNIYFTTKSRGTGLGMPVVKRILESHNGKIEVESTLGEGTVVRMSLPLKPILSQASPDDGISTK